MSAYINVKQVNAAGVGVKPWIQVNRWQANTYTLNMSISGAATYSVQGTLKKLTQETNATDAAAGTPAAADIFDLPSATGLVASTVLYITDTPLGAIRMDQTVGAGSVKFPVMQK